MSVYFTLKEELERKGITNLLTYAQDNKIRHGTLYDVCNNKIKRLPVELIEIIFATTGLLPGDWIHCKED